MGTDIHFYVERKCYCYKDNDKYTWVSIDKWSINPYSILRPDENTPRWEVEFTYQYYWVRNYCVFALLADIRNFYHIEPISKPRGLPSDVTNEIKLQSDSEGLDAHSHSWLLLSELNKVDWNKEFSWVSHHVDNEGHETNEIITKKYKDACSDIIEVIEKLNKIDNDENIRIVFWFDN